MAKGKRRLQAMAAKRASKRSAFASAVARNAQKGTNDPVSKYQTRKHARANGAPMSSRAHESLPWHHDLRGSRGAP
jgi:hypothetical protein